jgi:DNA-binding CsgD family transcriptional regulator/tetratricopeptide (TPR) repeat protein
VAAPTGAVDDTAAAWCLDLIECAGPAARNVVGGPGEDRSVARTSAPLVGRSDELADLVEVVAAARAGTAAALVLGGDAGVGKTRLLSELMGRAVDSGLLCLVGHCVDLGDTPPPYLPFSEAFTRLAAERPDDVDRLLTTFPALARLLPRRGAGEGPAVDDRVERGELFDSVHGALAALAADRPVALFLEDVHWADQATRDLVGYLFTRLDGERLAIIASYRSDDLHRRHPLRRTLAEWSRLPSVSRLYLDRLEPESIRSLVRGIHPEPLDAADVDGIVTRADGNAFFAEELLAATVQCTDARQLPWQLADLLLVRLDRLGEEAREVVRIAAVAGRRVSHTTLEAVAQLPGRRLDDALREAIDSHVLNLTDSGRGYTFRHALLAEAVYDDLLPGERVRLHAAYADTLAATPTRRPAELARHARASHDLATAFSASIEAGEEAMALAAPQEALQHFETALELQPRIADPGLDRPHLTLATVEAADAAGHGLRGVKLASAALAELPADAPDLDRATLLVALVTASISNEIGVEAFSQIAEAVSLIPAEPPTPFRARALALHARVAMYLGRDVEALRSAREALEAAGRTGSRAADTDARSSLAMIERRSGDPDEAARLLREVTEQSRASGDVSSELRTMYNLATLWYEQCDLEQAEAAYRDTQRRAVETGRTWENFGLMARAMLATTQYLRGDWSASLATLDVSADQPTPIGAGVLGSTAMLVRAGRGDTSVLDQVAALRPHFRREGRIPLYAGLAALEIHEQRGDHEAALALIDELVEIFTTLWLNPWFLARIQLAALGLGVLSAAAASAPQAQHAELAAAGARLVDDGRTSAERGLPPGRRMGREGRAWVARLEAEWARLRWLTGVDAPPADELVAAWEHAVTEFDYGEQVQTTRSRARHAAALRASGRTAEAAEVAALARAAAEQMGARPVLAELAALQVPAGPRRKAEPGAASSAGKGLTALTDRERDVLAELVDGRTNRQIAAKLFISEKTVSVHVSNILAKLGVRSRAEAAALARRDPAAAGA